jgi:tetratricopeptide (TPR) repeat protein
MLEVISTFCQKQLAQGKADAPATLTPAQMEQTRRRHAAYFLRWANELAAQLHRDKCAWRELEREIPNIRAAMDWALRAQENALAAEIALAVCPFFARRGYSGERLERAEAGRVAAQRAAARDPALVASLLHQVGWCHFDRSEFEPAKRRLLEAITLRRELLDACTDPDARKAHARWLGMSENTLSQCFRGGGSLPEAKVHAERALQLMRDAGDERGMALVLNNIGLIAKNEGKTDQAEEALEEALRYATAAGDLSCQAQVRNNLALVYERQGKLEQAEHFYTQAMKNLHAVGALRDVASCLSNLARLARRSGRLAQAERRESRALRIRRAVSDHNGTAVSLVQISTIRINQASAEGVAPAAKKKFLDDAKARAEEALQIWKQIQHKSVVHGLLQLGDVLMERGEIEAAAKCYLEANMLAADKEKYEDEIRAEVLLSWAKCAARLGDEQQAIHRYHIAHFLLWQSPTIRKYRSGTARDPSPPKEIRRLEEVLRGLSQLRRTRGDDRRAGWCLHVAALFAATHPAAFADVIREYEAFCSSHPDLPPLYRRWDQRIRKPGRDALTPAKVVAAR